MSFCSNCGTKCVDGAAFCSNCGSALNVAPVAEPTPIREQPAAPVYQQPVWEQPAAPAYQQPVWEQPAAPAYQQPVWEQPATPAYQQPVWEQPAQPVYPQPTAPVATPAAEMPTVSKVLGLIAMICGIASLPMALAYGSGLFLGIAALIMSSIANNKAAEVGLTNGKANTGKKLGLAGTIVGGIIFFIFMIIAFTAGASIGFSDNYYYY